ncbi:MAG: hypothetical protein LBE74_05575 [Treponema sp.]|jgi:hypothetical protein|nr:hypothetical protein [Treponema sp.]
MKKLVITAALMAVVLSVVFAQAVSEAPGEQSAQKADPNRTDKPSEFKRPEKTTVNGTLAFVRGRIAVQGADAVYFTGGLDRLVGFVDGFKEGAAVQLEGYVFTPPNSALLDDVKLIRTLKITFNGKSYELGADARKEERGRWTEFNSRDFHRDRMFHPRRSGSRHSDWNKRRFFED